MQLNGFPKDYNTEETELVLSTFVFVRNSVKYTCIIINVQIGFELWPAYQSRTTIGPRLKITFFNSVELSKLINGVEGGELKKLNYNFYYGLFFFFFCKESQILEM